MDTKDLKAMHRKLEQDIKGLIDEFQKTTGFEVSSVYVRQAHIINNAPICHVEVDAKL